MPIAKTTDKEHVQKYIDQMDRMLRDSAYDWAWDRIANLKDVVEHKQEIEPEIINCLQQMRRKCGDI
ncbi:hypothetical protein [Fodinibius sp.]|uniref:hypothetical protein n=1 Tax=Fodinibius sp. TaxID=1872440 RepID=UPI002ACDCF06|nr:hypothetical protein [Fodinibius sp.]MDZ7658044.1 hypothetical protein [Fodinibius sp.]